MGMDSQNVSTDTDQLKQLNRWLFLLVIFIVVWALGMVFYVQKRTEPQVTPVVPLVSVDATTGKITNNAAVNLFPPTIAKGAPKKSAYEQRESYQVIDFVIINYFFVEGLVLEKKGDEYTVLYKNEAGTLEKITVPKELLIAPASGTVVNPASLMSH
jgi:hypothetical protein